MRDCSESIFKFEGCSKSSGSEKDEEEIEESRSKSDCSFELDKRSSDSQHSSSESKFSDETQKEKSKVAKSHIEFHHFVTKFEKGDILFSFSQNKYFTVCDVEKAKKKGVILIEEFKKEKGNERKKEKSKRKSKKKDKEDEDIKDDDKDYSKEEEDNKENEKDEEENSKIDDKKENNEEENKKEDDKKDNEEEETNKEEEVNIEEEINKKKEDNKEEDDNEEEEDNKGKDDEKEKEDDKKDKENKKNLDKKDDKTLIKSNSQKDKDKYSLKINSKSVPKNEDSKEKNKSQFEVSYEDLKDYTDIVFLKILYINYKNLTKVIYYPAVLGEKLSETIANFCDAYIINHSGYSIIFKNKKISDLTKIILSPSEFNFESDFITFIEQPKLEEFSYEISFLRYDKRIEKEIMNYALIFSCPVKIEELSLIKDCTSTLLEVYKLPLISAPIWSPKRYTLYMREVFKNNWKIDAEQIFSSRISCVNKGKYENKEFNVEFLLNQAITYVFCFTLNKGTYKFSKCKTFVQEDYLLLVPERKDMIIRGIKGKKISDLAFQE